MIAVSGSELSWAKLNLAKRHWRWTSAKINKHPTNQRTNVWQDKENCDKTNVKMFTHIWQHEYIMGVNIELANILSEVPSLRWSNALQFYASFIKFVAIFAFAVVDVDVVVISFLLCTMLWPQVTTTPLDIHIYVIKYCHFNRPFAI